jgi:hypothetical protein
VYGKLRLVGIAAVLGLVALVSPSSAPTAGRAAASVCPVNWLRAVRVADIVLTGPNNGWAVANHVQAGGTWPITSGCVYQLAKGEWRPAPYAPVVPGAYGCYTAIDAVGSTDVWAAGMSGGLYSCQSGSVLVRLDGRRWASVDLDRVLGRGLESGVARPTGLLDVDMVDADHGWAVAWLTILRFEYGDWIVDFDADCCMYGFGAISMASLTDGWAGGRCGLYRYHKGSWTRWSDATFDAAVVSDIHAVAPDEAWAVGYSDPHCGAAGTSRTPLVWHYADERWERGPLGVGAGRFHAVRVLGSGEVWAVGEWLGPGSEQGRALALRYKDGLWRSFRMQSALPLRAVDALGQDTVWAGGDDGFFSYSPDYGWRKH